ncbi:MAG: hypothetical protein Q4A64_02360 [Porphyromonadaceae bacterium]|nr:hypothetical protein [Porphyromonadaceae bacterium]
MKRHIHTILSLLGLASLLCPMALTAQETSEQLPTYHALELGLGRIGYTLEKNIAPDFSVGFSIGVNSSFHFSFDQQTIIEGASERRTTHSDFGFSLSPALEVDATWYYNLLKRRAAGYNVSGNTANYITLRVSPITVANLVASSGYYRHAYSSALVAWGARRRLGESLSYHYQIGLSASYVYPNSYYQAQWYYAPAISVGIGYML